MATILVLGGGVGGLVAASELRQRLGREHRVVLVDRERQHLFAPSLLWLMVGLRKPEEITRDLASLERKGIQFVQGEVQAIDPSRRTARVNGTSYGADYLIIALGAQSAPELVPGLSQAGYNLCSLEGAAAIRDVRKSLTSGRLAALVSRLPYRCPAAPYEAIMLLAYDCLKRRVRDRVEPAIYSPEPGPMPVAGPQVSAAVRQLLEERAISYYPQHQVAEVVAGRTLRFTNGAEAAFDLLVYMPPYVAPQVVWEAGLTAETGWVPVDRHTLETRHPGVYALGDLTGIPLATPGLSLPKAGVFAHRQAEVVAENIAAQIRSEGRTATFDGQGECFVEVGEGKAGFGRGNFYADPRPALQFYNPGRHWHAGKVLVEKNWLRRWF